MNWKLWGRGLFAALIGGVSNGVTLAIADPKDFNLFNGGARELAMVVLVSAVLSMGMYLKTHPDPWAEQTVNQRGQ